MKKACEGRCTGGSLRLLVGLMGGLNIKTPHVGSKEKNAQKILQNIPKRKQRDSMPLQTLWILDTATNVS